MRDWIAARLGRIGDIDEAIERIDALSDHPGTGPAHRLALGQMAISLLLRAKRLNEAWRCYRLLALRHPGSPRALVALVKTLGDLAVETQDAAALHRARTELARLRVQSLIEPVDGPDPAKGSGLDRTLADWDRPAEGRDPGGP